MLFTYISAHGKQEFTCRHQDAVSYLILKRTAVRRNNLVVEGDMLPLTSGSTYPATHCHVLEDRNSRLYRC